MAVPNKRTFTHLLVSVPIVRVQHAYIASFALLLFKASVSAFMILLRTKFYPLIHSKYVL